MIEAKTAAKNAAKYLAELVPQASGVLLEEVELTSNKGRSAWSITLSFQLPPTGFGGLSAVMGRREYKSFIVDGSSGMIVSMKIRTV